jgi:NAD(P)H-dependent FMN reductase
VAAAGPRPGLLILWCSHTGGSQALARAAARGARGEVPAGVRLLAARRAMPADLLAAGGFLFVTPETLGSMAGQMKDLIDRSYYPLLGRLAGRPAALIVCAGSDGAGTVRQMGRVFAGWGLREAAPPQVVITGAQTPQAIMARKRIEPGPLQAASELGQALALGLSMGVW